jgi:hypothetical protein
MPLVVADTSPHVLFESVIVPEAVIAELCHRAAGLGIDVLRQ